MKKELEELKKEFQKKYLKKAWKLARMAQKAESGEESDYFNRKLKRLREEFNYVKREINVILENL
jgi:hypothetical protein